MEVTNVFLTERRISLLTYALALFLVCWLINRTIEKQWKWILFTYLALLCVFAFFYEPYITADLYRLREYIKYWTDLPWGRLITYAFRHSAPTWVFYSYAINKFGNINWLQTITCLWCFGNVFYIISHEIDRNGLRGERKSLPLFYVMAVGSFYIQTISGIRSMLGLSIIAFCFYRETIEGKQVMWDLPLYLFAAFIHSSVLPMVVARFLYVIIQYKNLAMKAFFAVLILVLGAFSAYYFRDFVNGVFQTGWNYLLGGKEYTYGWEILIGLIETSLTVYVLRRYRILYKGEEKNYDAIRVFCLIWTVICVVALPFSYAVFRRYTVFCTLISMPLLAKLLNYEQEKDNNDPRFYNAVWIVCMVIFALSGVRGDLCGYKFFVLP